MAHILIPVDGSDNALRAVDYAVAHRAAFEPLRITLLNVQIPIVSGTVRLFIDRASIDNYYAEEGETALKPARERVEQAGVSFIQEVNVGHVAESIAKYAAQHQCDHIIIGSRGMGSTSNWLLGSITTKVLHLADVPVTVVK
ncbi:MAG: universal stress protein [Alcaligenaceae bacterium]|nr:MAG: universal stress protein [Alcaligenaceae bacterium]